MKHFSTLTTVIVIAVIISACGAKAPPTANPADIAGTAQAAAFTMIAQTQAAIPTNTLPPPTDTPMPTLAATNTPFALPTQDLTLLASPTTAPVKGSGDPCATRILSPKKGKETIIRVWNSTKVTVRVSMYLNETKGAGECGWRSFDLTKNGDVIYDLVQGCYNLWAWSLDAKKKFQVATDGTNCINNPDKWTFIITESIIKFTGP